jgi:membrane-bound lytic murein transglycosylase A
MMMNGYPFCKSKKQQLLHQCHLIAMFALALILLAGCATPPTRAPGQRAPVIESSTAVAPFSSPIATFSAVAWQQIPGWQEDDLSAAWSAWLESCKAMVKRSSTRSWSGVCDRAKTVSGSSPQAVRRYFEDAFQAYAIRSTSTGSETGLVTGYYEPIMNGSRVRTSRYAVPLYGYPEAWKRSRPNPGPTRAELMDSNALRGSEIIWVEDPVAAAFMQIQGSGKIKLDDGNVLRFGFAGTNEQPFKSFAQWLLNKGEITRSQATMQGIQSWAKRNPRRVEEMLNANPRFVFFKELPSDVSPDMGPIGALGVPLTAERSIAVDLKAMPLGAPVFIATTRPLSKQTLRRLVIAQDTGKAIVGGVRADFYWGTGDAAGELAGRMKQDGQMWLLLPK